MSWTLRIVLLVLRSKKGRRLVLLAITGVVAAALMVFVAITGAVASVFSDCKEQMENLSPASSGDYPSSSPSQDAVSDIPGDLLELYQQYADEYGVDWALVAAVGKQESNHGQDYSGCATSEDNAQGIMQFIPSTWSSEGVDGNGDGNKDPCNDEDAIASGASYLANLGAAEDERGALCSYYGMCGDSKANYADEVMAQAEAYRGSEEGSEEGGGSSEGSGENSGEGSGSGDTSGETGGASGLIPPLMSEAYAAGVSDTPAGWSLVEPDKTMTYYSETRFDSYVESAVKEWNALGGVDIQPADSKEEANVVIFDGNSLDWAMGYTETTDYQATKGTIEINEQKVSEVATETNRKSLMVHELGHALGFQHQNDKPSVMNQDLNTDVPNDLDVRIYKETWGGEGSPANASVSQSYGEEEVSEECKASFWPWS